MHTCKEKAYVAAAAAIAMTAVTLAAGLCCEKKRRIRSERVNRRLADMNIKFMDLACESAGITDEENGISLPIDSPQVKKYRECMDVRRAEKDIFILLVYSAGLTDDKTACSLQGLYELISGDYEVTAELPVEYQRPNAAATVQIARKCEGKKSSLDGYSEETLLRGAILLENDICFAAKRSGII